MPGSPTGRRQMNMVANMKLTQFLDIRSWWKKEKQMEFKVSYLQI